MKNDTILYKILISMCTRTPRTPYERAWCPYHHVSAAGKILTNTTTQTHQIVMTKSKLENQKVSFYIHSSSSLANIQDRDKPSHLTIPTRTFLLNLQKQISNDFNKQVFLVTVIKKYWHHGIDISVTVIKKMQ